MTEDVKRTIRNLRNVSYSQCEDYSMYVITLARLAANKIEELATKLDVAMESIPRCCYYCELQTSCERPPVYDDSICEHFKWYGERRVNNVKEDRAIVLMKACLSLLNKQKESHFVLNLLEQTVLYDGADCDGYCLSDDIEDYLIEKGELSLDE